MSDNKFILKLKKKDIIITFEFIDVVNLYVSDTLIDSIVTNSIFSYKEFSGETLEFVMENYYMECSEINLKLEAAI